MDVLCCCDPSNKLGELPEDSDVLTKRECSDGTFAFDSNDSKVEDLVNVPGFLPSVSQDVVLGKKTWKKTWKKATV